MGVDLDKMLSDSTTSRQVLRAMEDAADVKKRRIVDDDEVNVKEALSTSSAPAPTTGGAQQEFSPELLRM